MDNYDIYTFIIENNINRKKKKFNDIKMRDILQVQDYKVKSVKYLEKLKGFTHSNPLSNFTYYLHTPDTICTEFLISTIDGIFSIPVIGMKHIRAKTQIKNNLVDYLPYFKKKNNIKIGMYLLFYTDLPNEMIQYILKFT